MSVWTHLRHLFLSITLALVCCCEKTFAHDEPGESPHDGVTNAKLLEPLWIGPAFSGSWYSRDRSGEGFVLEILDSGEAIAMWFTYPPLGSTAKQAWILAQGGKIRGNVIEFSTVFTTRGPRFGPAFNPDDFLSTPWGSLRLEFSDCLNGRVHYSGPSAWGSGSREISRLTEIAELTCAGKTQMETNGARRKSSLRQVSAAWYDPSHNGEGVLVEELPDGRAIGFWFTYDERGEQAWLMGIGTMQAGNLVTSDVFRPIGTNFGENFSASAVQLQTWGNFQLNFARCDSARLDYQSSDPVFGSGQLNMTRLTRMASTACLDQTISPPLNGNWSQGANMPTSQSELTVSRLGDELYVAGGYGNTNGFSRYNVRTNAWQVLPDLPQGRNHASSIALGNSVYVFGGYEDNGEDLNTAGWRYSISGNTWEAMPELPLPQASSAVLLNGFFYSATEDGGVYQYNPQQKTWRRLPAFLPYPRDHSQLIAFQGELWLMGGRWFNVNEQADVSIFDPASEKWRRGPTMLSVHAGFASYATDQFVFVAGGEILLGTRTVQRDAEVFSIHENRWQVLPNMPTAVHGVAGAVVDNALYLIGGSTRAGGVANPGVVQIYRWTP